jgi:lipopolysaccharide transport system permease protein
MQHNPQNDDWDLVIKGHTTLFDLRLKEVWHYRDLLFLFVKRDFVTVYKQTILGPLWFFVQPLLTTVTFTIIFGTVAKLSTDGAPKVVFYMAGITLWSYFSNCLTSVAGVFSTNASIFGKVYFPRLIMPLTVVISNLMKFGVQFLLFISFSYLFTYSLFYCKDVVTLCNIVGPEPGIIGGFIPFNELYNVLTLI